jgi:microcystin-dependent protein
MDAFLGEIRIFAGNYAPQGWSFCDGQLLSIQNYQALYALVGTTYGGDGVNTFAKPDLRGRLPIGDQQGTNLTNRAIGQLVGTETVELTAAQLPPHSHQMMVSNTVASQSSASGNLIGAGLHYLGADKSAGLTAQAMNAGTIGQFGGNVAHNNMMPFLVLNFIICLNGTFPSRN